MPIENASREILWNVHSVFTVVVMYAMLAASMVFFCAGLIRRVEFWMSGSAAPEHTGHYLKRAAAVIENVMLQASVNRRADIAMAHSLVFVGMLSLVFATTMVLIDFDLGIPIYNGRFYLAVTLVSDVLGFGVILGCLAMLHRRFIVRPDLLHSRSADWIVIAAIVLLCVQGFALEGLRVHATTDPWGAFSPVGLLFAKFFWSFSPALAEGTHAFMWWFHAVTVFVCIALLPYTKMFHIIASSANIFFNYSPRPAGALPYPGDIEEMIEKGDEFTLGLGNIQDYSWKHLLDLDACTSCGRCQNACPAYASGKPLSPKWMVLDTRNHALALHSERKLGASILPEPLSAFDSFMTRGYLESTCGVRSEESGEGLVASGEFRASNPLVQNSVKQIGGEADARIAGTVMDPDVFWSCNTCLACVEACPVGINHVDLIVENRRNMVLMEGEIPSEAAGTLRALETRSNPFGAPEDRIKWLEDLDVKVLEPGDSVDYLYWVGCVSSYDPRKQKIARSLVQIMNAAGLSFGILGTAEGCSGDPARRLGEENLFQALAKSNIETLKSIQFGTLVANCPHCFSTIKNEYPQLGNLGNGKEPEIIHHSVLLKRLVQDGSIQVKESAKEVTFHDPCYLGRANDEYEAPREALKSNSKLKIIEMDRSRNESFCCGAGGGHFWMDMKVGERVNVQRVEQIAETGASEVATACPFCMQMLEDGAKLTGKEESLEVKDIAEYVAENLQK